MHNALLHSVLSFHQKAVMQGLLQDVLSDQLLRVGTRCLKRIILEDWLVMKYEPTEGHGATWSNLHSHPGPSEQQPLAIFQRQK